MTQTNGLFKKAENQQAYLKVGILGFSGSGKTYTAALIAKGIVERLKTKKPVLFLDSETGSDFFVSKFKAWGIPLYVAKTRAFVDLLAGVQEAEKTASVLIVDSISHFWKEVQDAYLKSWNDSNPYKKRTRLIFPDWLPIKNQWARYTDIFINSKVHIIMCGRAGYEYDFFTDEGGVKQLEKTGTKMKAEGEMSFEPSLLLEMVRERIENEDKTAVEAKMIRHICYVLKDRADLINGKKFINPTFKDFEPVFNFLNIRGDHVGVDLSKDSSGIFAKDSTENYYEQKKQKDILIEEIQGELVSAYPGQSVDEKKIKTDLIYDIFGTRSWLSLQEFDISKLSAGRVELKLAIEKMRLTKKSDGK